MSFAVTAQIRSLLAFDVVLHAKNLYLPFTRLLG